MGARNWLQAAFWSWSTCSYTSIALRLPRKWFPRRCPRWTFCGVPWVSLWVDRGGSRGRRGICVCVWEMCPCLNNCASMLLVLVCVRRRCECKSAMGGRLQAEEHIVRDLPVIQRCSHEGLVNALCFHVKFKQSSPRQLNSDHQPPPQHTSTNSLTVMSASAFRIRADLRKAVDDAVFGAFAMALEHAEALYKNDKLAECIDRCCSILDMSVSLPRYHRIARALCQGGRRLP